jgi:hypothetical protein
VKLRLAGSHVFLNLSHLSHEFVMLRLVLCLLRVTVSLHQSFFPCKMRHRVGRQPVQNLHRYRGGISIPSVVQGSDYSLRVCGGNLSETLMFEDDLGPFSVNVGGSRR